ncbi:MAG: phage holin family protein [Bacteroidetes bacterium]|nr:phage holin family protein [Methylococcaceae bacterium]MBK9479898.1 phage holin family protein [Bacteroidota bacterium]MBK9671025.1 phage holin family protein [Bacteroidota bacterium]MBK9798268.1 phage holin family protein [Bacteroidota bacterium]MBP6414300.1 phage holin family protein [Bacteroidia bacterium]
MKFIFKIIVSALAVIITAYLLPGVKIVTPLTAIIVAAVLAFLDAIVKPLMILFTIPITIVTLGLFLIVINALMILLADYMVDGFEVKGFWWALLFSFILTIVTSLLESFAGKKNKQEE